MITPMSPEQIALVQDSWSHIVPDMSHAGSMFYERLFDQHPELRDLFHHELKLQTDKLMSMIDTTVMALDHMEDIDPILIELGKRHLQYGVNDEDYDAVEEALLWALDQALGDRFTAEVRVAWELTYNQLAWIMIEAARAKRRAL